MTEPRCHCWENAHGFIGDCPVHDVRLPGPAPIWGVLGRVVGVVMVVLVILLAIKFW